MLSNETFIVPNTKLPYNVEGDENIYDDEDGDDHYGYYEYFGIV